MLKCTSSYPAPEEDTNLKCIEDLRKKFKINVGLSDHTNGIGVAIASVMFGSVLIEKHFTLDKTMTGPDHSFSIDPKGLKTLISQIREIDQIKGNGIKIPQSSEIENRLAIRKSITAKRDMKQGEKIKEDDIMIKRPADGIEPKYFSFILGKTIKDDIKKDSPISWSNIS